MTLPSNIPLLSLLSLCIFVSLTRGEDLTENEIPAGLELSATLALFRNIPLISPESIPRTEGKVSFLFSDETSRSDGKDNFVNIYRFFRRTGTGKFLEITITERHQISEHDPESEEPYHEMADLSQQAAIVEKLPDGTSSPSGLSALVGYVLDHRVALIDSKAGELARRLNYGKTGRYLEVTYERPQISYLVDADGSVTKVRVLGLDSLLGDERSDEKDYFLEFHVDSNGVARAAMISPVQ